MILSFLENPIVLIIFYFAAIAVIYFLSMLLRKFHENEKLKYDFITIIAHKFRTPLTHMKWISENLIENEMDPFKKENLVELQKSNEKLIKLTGALIEITDSGTDSTAPYHFEKASLCDIVRSCSESLKSLFHEKNIFFSVTCHLEDIYVLGDIPRLEFVVQTLLENAYTYTSPGKNVKIEVGVDKHRAIIAVKDEGIGIEKHDMSKMFEKFYRTDNAKQTDTEGFGVGLYLAKSIIKQHRGSIEVYSDGLNQGSTFIVNLPLSKK